MSDSERRIQRIAIGAALLAVAIALVAVIVVVMRRDEPSAEAAPGPTPTVASRKVTATDVIKLKQDVVETSGNGIRVTDAALRKTLGLAADDTIVAISGHPVHATYELRTLMLDLSLLRPHTLFVDLVRAKQPVLERWELDGDLGAARRADFAASSPGYGVLGTLPINPTTPSPDPDTFAQGIKQTDQTTYEIQRTTIDAVLANPMAVAKSARVVPAIKNGQPEGLKLYAIRPGSVWAALGLQNGDTIRAINGYELTSADKALEVYTKLRDAKQITVDVTRRGQPMMFNYMIK